MTNTVVHEAINTVAAAKLARDRGMLDLRTRLSGSVTELDQLLSDDAPNWYAFGLNRPADPETPGVPDGLVLTLGLAVTVLVDWADARRAQRYRVYRQFDGVDPEFMPWCAAIGGGIAAPVSYGFHVATGLAIRYANRE